MLIGNKCDAESLRQVDREQGEEMARKMQVPFYECSCKNNINISKKDLGITYTSIYPCQTVTSQSDSEAD